MSTFTSLTAMSYSSCSLMANTMGKMAFVWQKDDNKCLVGEKVPGKKTFTHFLDFKTSSYFTPILLRLEMAQTQGHAFILCLPRLCLLLFFTTFSAHNGSLCSLPFGQASCDTI
jgi:hypothetical protein